MTQDKNEKEKYLFIDDEEPIHAYFDLTYASFLVIPRSVLQSMPKDWQKEFVKLLEDMSELFGGHLIDKDYIVLLRDKQGKFNKDDLGDYQRGRRRLEPKGIEEALEQVMDFPRKKK